MASVTALRPSAATPRTGPGRTPGPGAQLLSADALVLQGVTRTFGGWLSDKCGARTIMYGTLGASLILLILLFPPRMEVQSPGPGILAERPGTVTSVSPEELVVGNDRYRLAQPVEKHDVRVRLGIHADDRSQRGERVAKLMEHHRACGQVGEERCGQPRHVALRVAERRHRSGLGREQHLVAARVAETAERLSHEQRGRPRATGDDEPRLHQWVTLRRARRRALPRRAA